MKLVNRHAKVNLILSRIVVCAMMVFLYSCGSGGGSGDSSGTGSVSFGLALRESGTSRASSNRQVDDGTSPFECETDTYRISAIEAQVVDENEELLAEGGPFECEDRQGDIGEVAAGGGRIVKVFAIGESGELVAEGESMPVTVIAGQTVNAGKIVLKLDNSAPVADAGPGQTPFVGETVILDGSGSSDVDGDLLSFSWSIISRPSGSQAVLSDPTAVNPAFDVDEFGEYAAQLIVNDGTVDSEPDTVIINTDNSAPVADAGPDQTPFVGETVALDGSGSSDVDGDVLSFSWSFTNLPPDSQAILSDPTAADPTFDVDVSGEYIAQLIVNDGTVNSEPDTVNINTENSVPVADAGSNQTVTIAVPVIVTLDGSGSSDVDGDALSYSWSFTRIPSESQAQLSDPNAVDPSFSADLIGDYIVQLIVNDGTVDSLPVSVTITGNPIQ